jgi:hypothetical protein
MFALPFQSIPLNSLNHIQSNPKREDRSQLNRSDVGIRVQFFPLFFFIFLLCFVLVFSSFVFLCASTSWVRLLFLSHVAGSRASGAKKVPEPAPQHHRPHRTHSTKLQTNPEISFKTRAVRSHSKFMCDS